MAKTIETTFELERRELIQSLAKRACPSFSVIQGDDGSRLYAYETLVTAFNPELPIVCAISDAMRWAENRQRECILKVIKAGGKC